MSSQPDFTPFPIVGYYTQEILKADDLMWIVGAGSNDALAILHEMNPPGKSIHDYICRQFKPGKVFLDIGAHAGHYAIRAAVAGCTVYAVEANPETVQQLYLNCYLNKLVDKVQIWGFAAWDKRELLDFTVCHDAKMRNGSASVASPDADADGISYEPMGLTVAAVPLDDRLDHLDRLDIVKMDVEGSDIHVIDGMLESLVRLKPLLLFENHEFYGTYTAHDMALRESWLTDRAGYSWLDAGELGVVMPGTDRYRIGTPPPKTRRRPARR